MAIAPTAADAFERYERALQSSNLCQYVGWQEDYDGHHFVCALGVLGDEVDSPPRCPAAVMPRWLAQHVPFFFNNQAEADAFAWGHNFYAELKRIDGKVPFSVVYDWHATVVAPLAMEVSQAKKRSRKWQLLWKSKRKFRPETHYLVQELHLRALNGDQVHPDQWYDVLMPAYADIGATNPDPSFYADAFAGADADLYAAACAECFSYADDYAEGCYGCVHRDAGGEMEFDLRAMQACIKRLADGMLACLRRVPSPAQDHGVRPSGSDPTP